MLEGISRNESGYRLYSENDISWVQFLMLLRRMDMPISEMKQYSDLRSQGPSTVYERRLMLESLQAKVKNQIRELEENLKRIEDKIRHYKTLEEEHGDNQRA